MTLLPGSNAVDPARRRRWGRRWLAVAVALWAVLLLTLAVLSARGDEPTVREQRGIDRALPVMATAAGRLVAAAGGDSVVELGAVALRRGCRVTPMRGGATAHREVIVHPPAGTGSALLDRVAEALPAEYRAQVFADDGGGTPVLEADAGQFVGIRGRVADDGVVTFSVATGCRPVPDRFVVAGPPAGGSGFPPQRRLLTALGRPVDTPVDAIVRAPCPAGGSAETRVVTVRPASADLSDALRPVLATAAVTRAEPDRYAYRADDRSVVIEAADDGIRVAATAACG